MAIKNHNYNHSIRFYNAVFMELFNDVYLKRDTKNIKVPIEFVDKRKEEVLRSENPGAIYSKNMTLPRMGYRLTNMQYAADRNKNRNTIISGNGKSTLNRKPFDLTYELHIRTKNMDDMYEIAEQIFVQFDPYLELDVVDNEHMEIESNIAVNLDSNGFDTLSSGLYTDEQIIEATLQFTLKGYLYFGNAESKIIKKVIVNYFDLDSTSKLGTDIITEEGIVHE